MGNCQDQFQNFDQYQTQNDKSQVLIDRSHKRVIATKFQRNIGYLINNEERQNFDTQILHKSLALGKSKFIDKPLQRSRRNQQQTAKIQPLNLKFYHSLGLPEYTYKNKKQQEMKMSKRSEDKDVYIHQIQDRVGVTYVGERNGQGRFHGNGVLKANTVIYIGQFFQGTKHYHGRQIYTTQVYEGQFQYDIRKGYGTRYTQEFIDEGEFDKLIEFGERTYFDGNFYRGQFLNNKMHSTKNSQFIQQSWFFDAQNKLLFKCEILFQEGKLIKSKQVYSIAFLQFEQREKQKKCYKRKVKLQRKNLIGCYINQRIVKKEDNTYQQILQNWDDDKDVNLILKNFPNQDLLQEQKIKQKIQNWE